MAQRDEMEKRRLDKRNELEEYVYELRQKLEGELKEYAERSERDGLFEVLAKFKKWLDEQGRDEEKEVFDTKLEELMVRRDFKKRI